MAVAHASQKYRHTRSDPCKVCGGYELSKSNHCDGFRSADGYAHCSSKEYAGALRPDPNGHTFPHWLEGPCKCAHTHLEPSERGGAPLRLVGAPRTPVARKIVRQLPTMCADLPLVAQYPYRDEDGRELYRELRYAADGKKTFLQAQPEPGGKSWILDLQGVERVLYRLPELLEADPRRPVYICEGEKDCDRLAKLGLVATTNAGGAGSWHTVLDAPGWLTGRRVVILEDNDAAGVGRTQDIAASLEGLAASIAVVRFPEMPEHSDISDWLDAGGAIGDLIGWVQPLYTQDAAKEKSRTCPNCASMNEKLQTFRDLAAVPNSKLSHLDKWNLVQNLWEVEWKPEPDEPRLESGHTPVRIDGYRGKAEKIGASPDQVSKSDAKLESRGLISRTHYSVPTAMGNHKRVAIAVAPDWRQKIRELPDAPKKHGGYHPKATCGSCGSTNVKEHMLVTEVVLVKTTIEIKCLECGVTETLKYSEVEKSNRILSEEEILYTQDAAISNLSLNTQDACKEEVS